ncbi:MAG: YDG domain-containing protein [Lachnospiraceae bacterium]|nr:YDG domain-containing protein [Lachnospiraceae bacterium]
MRLKDKIIKKLLNVGKKHRILVYPTLALVAVVSAISQMICWGKGNGKRVVASIMIMAMLVTQSLFLSSDAASMDDGEDLLASNTDAAETQEVDVLPLNDADDMELSDSGMALLAAPGEIPTELIVYFVRVDERGNGTVAASTQNVTAGEDGKFTINLPDNPTVIQKFTSENPNNFKVTGCYTDLACSTAISESSIVIDNTDPSVASGTYTLYYKMNRTAYDVEIVDVDGTTQLATKKVDVSSIALPGEMNPETSYPVDQASAISAYKTGYTYQGLSYGGASYDTTQNIPITNATGTITYTADWKPQIIELTFTGMPAGLDSEIVNNIEDTTTQTATVSYTYGGTLTLPGNTMGDALVSEAYYISQWSCAGETFNAGATLSSEDAMKLVRALGTVSLEPNIEQNGAIDAVWSYKDIALSSDSEILSVGASAGDGAVITAVYGDAFSATLGANYKLDGKDSTGFTYQISSADNAILNQYGIVQSPKTDANGNRGITFSSTKTLDVPTTTIKINVTITDSHNSSISQNCPITLNILPKEITIDASSVRNSDGVNPPSKEYSGNSHIDIKTTANLVGVLDSDDVTVSFKQSASFDNANVGTGKAVTLEDVSLDGTHKHRYTIPDTITLDGIGTISQKGLTVIMALQDGQTDVVKFGNPTPKYELDLDAASVSALAEADRAVYNSYLAAGNTTQFVKEYVGFTDWSTARTLYSNPKAYSISPLIDSTGKNYSASASGLTMNFLVTRDDGTAEHELIGDKVNNYYKSLVIKPLRESTEYDQIRRVTDGNDITEGMSESEVLALGWSSSISIEDMADGTVQFQMRSSSTGAVTRIVTIPHVYVDSHGPVIEKVSATPKSFINSFNFGSYYHSQEGVEFVTLKIYYTSEDSPCTNLYYYFEDQNGSVSGETHVGFVPNPAENNYVATITIGTANRGQLVVYAEDQATNTSGRSRVRMDVFDEMTSVNDYYEWMVENNIEDAEIDVKDADGISAVADTWYNKLCLSVNASDDESGVNSIVWNIQTPDGVITPAPAEEAWQTGKNTSYTFNYVIADSAMPIGAYTISAVLKDNAGNTVTTPAVGPYMVDCKFPDISIDAIANRDEYSSGVDFDFTVIEGSDESGIYKVTLYKQDGTGKVPIKVWNPADDDEKHQLRCEGYRIVNNGTYILEAEDIAGNINSEERTFTKLSTSVPDAPEIDIDGELGTSGWYKGENPPEALITCQTVTADGVPVTTKYKVSAGNSSNQSTVDAGDNEERFTLNAQGTITIEAWSISESGIESAVTKKIVNVDTTKPSAEIMNAYIDENGDLYVNFRLKDAESGIDVNKVYVNGNRVEVTAEESSYIGKIKVDTNANYQITASDIAGNTSEAVDYVPLQMFVAPVTEITATTAYLEADVIVGTYDVNECYIAYKKQGETAYRTALFNKTENGNRIHMDCGFRDLTPDTLYQYKVFASDEKSQICVEEGVFRTLSSDGRGTVHGTVTYAPDYIDKDYPVYVSLYEANTLIASKKIESSSDEAYSFDKLKDGAYRVVATNGVLIETASVMIENAGVILPENYAAMGGVNLVFNGLSTEVVIEDGSILLTADNLESIYDNSVYKGILTDEDVAVLEAGGSIKITLHANYMDADDVSTEEKNIFKLNMAQNAVIEKYIELTVSKEVWDQYGNYVNGTPKQVPELYNPITISFPLGDLAGQNIYVASVHNNNGNYSFMNWTTAPEAIVSDNYITIQTRFFSVYALYRVIPSETTYIVNWKDGDGRVMKTEIVQEGTAATPPTEVPTKAATDSYTFEFVGWDADYSNVTSDMVIMAQFRAVPISDDPSQPDKPSDPDDPSKPDDPSVPDRPADVTPPENRPNSYTYLGSPESPKTGDATPIVLLVLLMGAAGCGMVFVSKKYKNNQ